MLKKVLLFICIFIAASHSAYQNQIHEIGKINLITDPISNVTIYYPTEFILRNKKEIAKVYSLDLVELIEKKLAPISDIKIKSSALLITDKSGNINIVSFSELLQDISVIPPMIVFDKVRGTIGDTVTVQDHGMGDLEFSAIDDELAVATKRRIYLQIGKIGKLERELFFNTISIVFPTDISTNRWIHDVVEIKLIEVE